MENSLIAIAESLQQLLGRLTEMEVELRSLRVGMQFDRVGERPGTRRELEKEPQGLEEDEL